jgi:hypothetical protein
MTLPQFPGWELINEILIDLEDALDANRDNSLAGDCNWKKNEGRKKGLKQAVTIVRSAVYDLELSTEVIHRVKKGGFNEATRRSDQHL